MTSSRRWLVLLHTCLIPFLLASVAAADQQRIFAIIPVQGLQLGEPPVTQLLEAVVENGQVASVATRLTTPGYPATSPSAERIRIVGGGRFVVWEQAPSLTASRLLHVFDRVAGSLSTFPDNELGISDPTRPRLFIPYRSPGAGQDEVATLTESGLAVIPNTSALRPAAVSNDGGRLFATGYRLIAVIDTTTGERLRTIDLPADAGVVDRLALSEDESRIWAVTYRNELPTFRRLNTIRAFNTVTGVEEFTAALAPDFGTDGLVIDDVNRRAVVAFSWQPPTVVSRIVGELHFVSTETGSRIAAIPLRGFSDIHLDRQSRTLVVVSRQASTRPSPSCGPVAVYTFSAASTSPLISESASGQCLLAAIASPPAPPQFHVPTVAGDHTVTLSWTPPTEMTTGFVVEAGSAPGLADLASIEVSGSSISVPNVASGTYYVRLRSRNDLGVGAASNERRVDVP